MSRFQDARQRVAIPVFALILSASAIGSLAATEESLSISDLRFAAELGTAVPSNANPEALRPPLAPSDFRGTSGRSCSTLDLNTFLHQFDPRELLAELKQSLLTGAQSEISNFLVALAYSAPTLTSTLDLTDRQLHARFTSFAQTCMAQQMRVMGPDNAERRFGQASDQCFTRETSRGIAPTEAYRRCALSRSFDAFALPATLTTLDFLRQHSDLAITPRIESLLALLPEERIVGGNFQVRTPKVSVGLLSEALRTRSRLAIDQVLNGTPPTSVPECTSDSALEFNGAACLPKTAFGVVDSPAFRSARVLRPTALSMFEDALAGQVAVVAVYSDLMDLGRQIAGMNLRTDSDASASEMLSRRRNLQEQVSLLLAQADLQVKLEQSKLLLTRTQLLALERSLTDLEAKAEALQARNNSAFSSAMGLLRLFQSGD